MICVCAVMLLIECLSWASLMHTKSSTHFCRTCRLDQGGFSVREHIESSTTR